jgi:hypothetical protein
MVYIIDINTKCTIETMDIKNIPDAKLYSTEEAWEKYKSDLKEIEDGNTSLENRTN